MINTKSRQKKDAISFATWMNTPMKKNNGALGMMLRCAPQFPDYNTYTILDNDGNYIDKGFDEIFYTIEELYKHYKETTTK